MVFGGFFDEPQRSRPKFSKKEKELHYKAQNGKCNGCGKKFDIRNLTVDHIKAFSKGGGERGHNLQLLCAACNSMKGNGTQERQWYSGATQKAPCAEWRHQRTNGIVCADCKGYGGQETGHRQEADSKGEETSPV